MSTERLEMKDILSGIKVPKMRGHTTSQPLIRVRQNGSVRFTSGLLFELGFPKKVVFSFSRNEAFIIPDPDIEGAVAYDLRSTKSKKELHFIQNKDLYSDLAKTFNKKDKDFMLRVESYMEIKTNKVFRLSVLVKPN